uniref:Beta-lactamase-related domain-containing protein n=1 Tax=Romanomermis culicivorax TaxID=13658 RepID=A0A915IYK2_ROMCU
ENYDRGWDDEGSAFAVYKDDELLVDLWGGYADSTQNVSWTRDTFAVVFSTTKIIRAACAISLALLVDRGLISYDDLVVKYWPEFGKHGKKVITVRMLASHQAGLVALDDKITFETIRNYRKMSQMLENQVPNWKLDEKAFGYHLLTYGFLIDQIIRRVDPEKRSLGKFFSDEIAKPHNLEFFIGLPAGLENNVARITQPTTKEFVDALLTDPFFVLLMIRVFCSRPNDVMARAMKNPEWLVVDENNTEYYAFNDPELYKLEIGGAAGIGTARSLAKLMCLFVTGKIVGPKTLNQLKKPLFEKQTDIVLNIPMTIGHGFEYARVSKDHYMIGHSGYGGQNVKADLDRHVCLAYIRNGLSHTVGDFNWSYKKLKYSVYAALKKIKGL